MTRTELQIAETVIRDARAAYDDTNPDAFDFYTAANGIQRYGHLYNEVYILANANHRGELRPNGIPWTEEEIKQHTAEEKTRASELWDRILPWLHQYADWCKASKFSEWSRASQAPVHRTDSEGREFPWS